MPDPRRKRVNVLVPKSLSWWRYAGVGGVQVHVTSDDRAGLLSVAECPRSLETGLRSSKQADLESRVWSPGGLAYAGGACTLTMGHL